MQRKVPSVALVLLALAGPAPWGCGDGAPASSPRDARPAPDGATRDAAAADATGPLRDAAAADATPRRDGTAADGPRADGGAPLAEDADYTPDDDPDLLNPERGIYYWSPEPGDPHTLVAEWLYLDAACGEELVWNGHGAAGTSALLDAYATRLLEHRAAGRKVLFRPRYDTPASDAINGCGVFQADTDERQRRHVGAVAAMLGDFVDVIAFVEAGYLGRWGEWNHAGYSAAEAPILTDPTRRRAFIDEVVRAYQARGVDRFVGLRRPLFARELADAFPPSGARAGFYDDCFMTNDSDYGTYSNFEDGNASNFADEAAARAFAEALTAGAPFGGETCPFAGARWQSCANMVGAASEPARLHLSYLHGGYAPDARATWEAGGCYDEIKRRLGYRFEIERVTYAPEVSPGETATVRVRIRNTGWSRLHNPRRAFVVLRSATGAHLVGGTAPGYATIPATVETHVQVGDFAPGQAVELEQSFVAPARGDYELRLLLPDPVRPEVPGYAVRIASRRGGGPLFDPATRENGLGVRLRVR